MGLTGRTRVAIATGIGALLAGTAVTLDAIARTDPAQALGGLCLVMVALTLIALLFIHHWFTNTSEERHVLAERTRAAEEEQNRYVSLKAALENEQGRLARDMAAERASLAERLVAEREALISELEERRAVIVAETMEATVRMYRNGKFAPQPSEKGILIPFPKQQPERARAHGHNGVGP